ncbi:ABC transporter substrate-binding protein [Paenibacillus sp. sptzw28]|uniref:ABC transporter substrate-binding protein n=1 Tax=Paenibacillus sp. sptzw28 TaxID=715179 RepID=UPI001C6DE33E|nr:ABC transporter substrate-binding protein [Paenibacillus sp. sptzw28]QYR20200.1 ABC transporter substrate-binding protein [Paenibacillus sp. sptzw28]
MGVKTRRSLWLSLTLILALSMTLLGCSKNSGTGNGDTGTGKENTSANASGNSGNGQASDKPEPITISIYNGLPGQAPTPDNKIFKRIKDELGVTLEQEFLVGDSQQKLGVMIAGGDYPDMITADPKLVASGAVIPLEDLIEKHGPNLKKHYEKYWNRMKDSNDGHIYWLPNYGAYTGEVHDTWYAGPAFWIQKAVLKEYGYPKLTTLDEYLDLIRKYAKAQPTIDGQPTIGFTSLAFDWKLFPLFNPPEHLTGHPNDGGVVVDNGVASVFADKDIAKRYYKELNGLYNEGLMDKEAFVQNYDQYLAKLSTGRVLGMFDQHWNFGRAEDSLTSQNKIDRTYVGFPLVYDSSYKEYYRDRPVINLNNGYGITVDAKDPVRIIKFLDALLDEKWQKLLSWGVEGEDYMVGEGGKFYRTEEQRKAQEAPTWKLANKADVFYSTAPKLEGSYSDGNATSPGSQPDEFFNSLKPLDKEVLTAYGHKTWTEFFASPPENPVYYPAWQVDLISGSPADMASKKMNDTSLKFLPRAIMSKTAEFDSVWDSYVKEFRKIDVKAYEDRINEQLQWRIKNWSTN